MDHHLTQLRTYLNGLMKLDVAEFSQLVPKVQLKKVKKGDRILEAGNRCENLYFICDGLFRVYHLKSDTEVNTCFCGEDEITCSFESFTRSTVSNDFIEAIEDSTVLAISSTSLAELSEKNPVWDELRRVFTDLECIRLSNRVDTLSFSTAQDKYASLMNNQKELIQRVPVQHLASYLGISRETLSRIRSKQSSARLIM
ncbi:MAG: Crp/Fnr family transcriptional regulator [Crocinitomicaceae bacterium]